MLSIRAFLFNVSYAVITVFFGVLAIFLWVLPYSLRYRIVLLWNRLIIGSLRLFCGVHYHIVGKKPDLDTPYVVMAKHQCAWETFFLQFYFSPISTILKRELLRIPFFGWGLALTRPIAIDRSNPVQALKQISKIGALRVQQGNNILIFPEGTRTPVGEVGNYARSGADIAVKAGIPVIPVAHNAGRFWVNKTFIKNPGTVTIVIGEPIATEGKNSKAVTAEVKEWIEKQMETL